MAATSNSKKHRKGRARGSPRAGPPLTPAQQKFQDLLRECLPMERKFVQYKLARKTNTEAAILAGYSERTADVQGAQLLARLRIWDAYQAGLEAAGFGALDVLSDIQALRTFDRSQIEREVRRVTHELVERPVRDLFEELTVRLKAVTEHTNSLEDANQSMLEMLGERMLELEKQRVKLAERLALDPNAVELVMQEVIVTDRVIDFELAKQRGLLRFIKGRRQTKYGEVIELHDWVEGVDMGARAKAVYRDRHELTGKDGAPLASATVLVLPSNSRTEGDE